MFGAVVDGGYLLDGRIALLDILKKKVSIFSGSGDFIRCAGCGGNGPGEFQAPFSLAVLSNGGFAVSDIHSGKIVFFDSSCSFIRELAGFQPMAPDNISGGANSAVIGQRMNYYYDDDEAEVFSGWEYCLWSESTEPDLVFQENYYPHSSDDHVQYSFISTMDGRFFCAPISTTKYVITGYSVDGDTSFSIEVPWEIRNVTPEELDAARPGMVIPGPRTESTSSELSSSWVPDSVRSAAVIVGFNGKNRLWLKSGRGATASPVFDLYGMSDGSFITSVETTLPAIAGYWSFRVSESGILGWDHNPDDFARVYILELVERN